MVVNLDETSQPGTHWVAICAKSPSEVWYFDSYGEPPEGNVKEMLKTFQKITINTFVIQSILSNVCAAYCIYFIYMCAKGFSYSKILSNLSAKPNMDVC